MSCLNKFKLRSLLSRQYYDASGKSVIKKIFALLILWQFGNPFFAQSPINLKIQGLDPEFEMAAYFGETFIFDSEGDVRHFLRQSINRLREDGYLTASVDSFFKDSLQFVAVCHIGQRYSVKNIFLDHADSLVPTRAQKALMGMYGRSWSSDEYNRVIDQILNSLANAGYPFSQAFLDDVSASEDAIEGRLRITTGPLILFDTLDLSGDLHISQNFMKNYLGIQPSQVYDHSRVGAIEKKVAQLGFASLANPPKVRFFESKAVVNLELEAQRNSRFDFLIGVLPNNSGGMQNLSIALNLTAELHNKLGLGEYIFAQIQRIRPENQELHLAFNYPYLLQLPFGIEAELEIYRNAAQYLEVNSDLGWQYLFSGRNRLKAFWTLNSSRLIDIDPEAILLGQKLPDQLDLSYSAGGVSLFVEEFDYRFNPLRGFSLNLEAKAGLKKIIRNAEIESLHDEVVDFSESYDSLDLTSFQYRLKTALVKFFPLGVRTTAMTRLTTGCIISGDKIYNNEMFRIGGSRLLRGFDEESIFSNFYMVLTAEYRLILNQNSYLSTFTDFGISKNNLLEDRWDRMMGIGAGLNFETRAGIFGISAAIGRRKNIPFSFRSAKIHFGYQNLF